MVRFSLKKGVRSGRGPNARQRSFELSSLNAFTTDQNIAEGLRQGSSEAFHALYIGQGRAVLTYLARLTGRKEMAEELTQETFLTVIRKIGFFRSGPDGSLKAWVFRIATHLAIDTLRREARMKLSPAEGRESGATLGADLADEGLSPEEELTRFEFSEALAAGLMELTPAQRTVFLLKEQEEMSLVDISRVCGCSENAIKQSLFRSRTILRKKLCR